MYVHLPTRYNMQFVVRCVSTNGVYAECHLAADL